MSAGHAVTDTATTPVGPLRAIVEELVRAGVRDVVVCPGSRSTPLALALRANPELHIWMHLDERAGAFFALGAAKASRRPIAIVATSGTAAANFLPAMVEARQGRVPLVALTADRPPELRDRGAPQAIDQDHLYGRFAKWYAELPVPDESPLYEANLRSVVGRAVVIAAAAPAGPVHLNLPFREPLLPVGSLSAAQADPTALSTGIVTGIRTVDSAAIDGLGTRLAAARRGLIVCGPQDVPGFPDAVTRLAAQTGFPILADGLSNLRLGRHDRSHVIARHDALLRSRAFSDDHVPDLVLRFGVTPTSKLITQALQAWSAPQIVVDDGGWAETTLLPLTMVQAEPKSLATMLTARLGSLAQQRDDAWLPSWLQAEDAAEAALRRWLAAQREPFEGAIFPILCATLPDGALLFAGNGMPVWDMDAFLDKGDTELTCLGNRGANGIDGLVSTALGAAAMQRGPVVAVVGDISFIHDLNALVSAVGQELSATIVLVNNDGGGIFSFLPQAAAERPELGLPEHYEELFGTPHGLDLGPLVTALGAEHRAVGLGTLQAAVSSSLARPGVQVLEIRTARARNVELHHEATAAVAEALGRLPTPHWTEP
ncbi:MAG: 2-succinyl-5-enolpyruvyl-6-hydroxy-3-cyclohexene-1-carboxylic-acid synthase [Chloroflexota bacterium]